MTTALEGGKGSASRPGPLFTPGKDPAPIRKVYHEVQFLNPEDGDDRLSRNFGKELSLLAA